MRATSFFLRMTCLVFYSNKSNYIMQVLNLRNTRLSDSQNERKNLRSLGGPGSGAISSWSHSSCSSGNSSINSGTTHEERGSGRGRPAHRGKKMKIQERDFCLARFSFLFIFPAFSRLLSDSMRGCVR